MAVRLPRLPVGYEKAPGLFPRYWDEAMNSLEKTLNQILLLPEIQAAVDAANAAADNANASATSAQATADAQASEASLVSSFIDPASFSGDLISADSAGNITIASHTRVYGNTTLNPNVVVDGGIFAVSGAVSGDVVRVFYTDAARTGGTVTYIVTIDPAPPLSQGNDIHSVGAVSIPASGSSSGNYIDPPGYVYL